MATSICPRLFITASPVPTPIRNDANISQKSSDVSVCAIVCSSPSRDRSPGARASFTMRSSGAATATKESASSRSTFTGTVGSPRSPRQDRRHGSGGREEHQEHGNEDDPAPAAEPSEVRDEEVQRDCHGERVDCGEAEPVVLLVRSGDALTEEHHGERADGGRHDGEHDEERGRVVGEERGAGVGEDGGAEADVALEQVEDGAPAPAEVADAGDEHGGVHPRGAVPIEAEEDADLPVGERGDGPGHDHLLRAVAEEALEGADGEEEPGGDAVGR
jgi:hypothetical protein